MNANSQIKVLELTPILTAKTNLTLKTWCNLDKKLEAICSEKQKNESIGALLYE